MIQDRDDSQSERGSLKPKTRKVLEARYRAPTTAQRDVKRARIVLLAAEGRSTRSIAEEVGVQPRIVSNWRRRFAEHGIGGLQNRPRASKKPIYGKATNKRILALLDKPPPQGYARWTVPLLAKALGDVDVQYVSRFLREHTIDLAARKSWCESNNPSFVAKAADVVGLYVDPPVKAIVLCVDEKPSIQALERAQGYLKLPNGRALISQSHNYKRHGTTTLFAALEVATVGSSQRIPSAAAVSSSSASSTASSPPSRVAATHHNNSTKNTLPKTPLPSTPHPRMPTTKRVNPHATAHLTAISNAEHISVIAAYKTAEPSLDQKKNLPAAVQKSPYHSTHKGHNKRANTHGDVPHSHHEIPCIAAHFFGRTVKIIATSLHVRKAPWLFSASPPASTSADVQFGS